MKSKIQTMDMKYLRKVVVVIGIGRIGNIEIRKRDWEWYLYWKQMKDQLNKYMMHGDAKTERIKRKKHWQKEKYSQK